MSEELTVVRQQPMAIAVADPTPADMFRSIMAVIEKGNVTPEAVGAVAKAMELCEHMEKRNSEKAFNRAFAKLQSELPVIVAKTVIPNRGKYERFEDVMDAISKHLSDNGFSISFKQLADDKRITVTCRLKHNEGHAEETPFAVRLGGRADSDTQSDCKASTTAKRNSLLQALNIVIRQDCLSEEGDARMEGGPITPNQAEDLHKRVCDTGSDERRFLAFAKAPIGTNPTSAEIKAAYEKIPSAMLSILDQTLRRREKTT